jgi:HPt (histidine-containing phosphotransfer) domain-containing protein
MTAHAMQGDREHCLAAGMDAYISKPIQGEELIEMVESVVQVGAVSPQKVMDSTPVPVFDRVEALNRLQGDQELLADSAKVFLKNSPGQLADICNAIERGDLAGLEHTAHSLKSSVGSFGARRTFNVVFELEKAARSGDLAECSRLCVALEAEMEALKPELLRLGADEA